MVTALATSSSVTVTFTVPVPPGEVAVIESGEVAVHLKRAPWWGRSRPH